MNCPVKCLSQRFAIGKPIQKQLKTFGVPEEFIGVLAAFATDIKNGLRETVSSDLAQLLGHNPADLKQNLKEIYRM